MRCGKPSSCIEQAGDGIVWIDPKGRITFTNRKARELLDYSQEELESLTVFDIDVQLTCESRNRHWEMIREKKSFVVERYHCTKVARSCRWRSS